MILRVLCSSKGTITCPQCQKHHDVAKDSADVFIISTTNLMSEPTMSGIIEIYIVYDPVNIM